jgi:hypothetical protein
MLIFEGGLVMKTRKLFTVLIVLTLISFSLLATPGFAINITPSGDTNILVNNILGPGITIVSASYDGSELASGTFTGGIGSGLGMESGIILTSGYAASAVGPNQNGSKAETIGNMWEAYVSPPPYGIPPYDTSTSLGLPGYAPLNALTGGGYPTFDASVLTFTFTSNTGNLFFNFVFASEEYLNFVNTQYNDVFGFFLDGVNIAVVPGTSTPITVNTINPGTNSAYYKNNINPSPFDLEYDGFTTVLVAQALGLSPGEHTLILAVADTSDDILDAAVFIQGLSDQPIPIPPTILLLGSGLLGLVGLRRFRKG